MVSERASRQVGMVAFLSSSMIPSIPLYCSERLVLVVQLVVVVSPPPKLPSVVILVVVLLIELLSDCLAPFVLFLVVSSSFGFGFVNVG